MSQNNKINDTSEKYYRPEVNAKWENTSRKKYKAPQPNTYNRNRLKLTKVKKDKSPKFGKGGIRKKRVSGET